MVSRDHAELEALVRQAFQTRLEGNELFKAGDLKGALLKYHHVLLVLKGVNWPTVQANASSPPSSIEEISYDESEKIEAEESKDKGTATRAVGAEAPGEDDMAEQIRNAIKNTYLNSAAIYIKQERWQRALESAKAAQRLDPYNPKAKFREGQALIGLGQIHAGKRHLEELQMVTPDPAVAAALNKLAADEAVREAKKNVQFKGMLNRKASPSKNGDKPAVAAAKSDEKAGSKGEPTPAPFVDTKQGKASAVAVPAEADLSASKAHSTARSATD